MNNIADPIVVSSDMVDATDNPLGNELSVSVISVERKETSHIRDKETLLSVGQNADPTSLLRDIQGNHVKIKVVLMCALAFDYRIRMIAVTLSAGSNWTDAAMKDAVAVKGCQMVMK